MRPSRSTAAFWLATLLALGASRLPYLNAPLYVLDNDEAVLGIMARHIAAGSALPLYFAGQNYGLAIFEALPAALAFKVFGDAPLVLALTILSVFLVGLIPYSRAFLRLSGSEHWARALTIGLALLPGWVVWSLKARGIYVAGFVLTGVALALLTRPAVRRRDLLGVGVLMGLIGAVQPLWLAVTVPFLLLLKHDRRDVLMACLVFLAVWLIPTWLSSTHETFWQAPRVGGFTPRMSVVPGLLSGAFSGRVTPNQPGFLAGFLGGAGTAGFFLLIPAMAADLLRRRSAFALAAGVAMILSLLHVAVLSVWVPRYFLPSTVLAVVAMATWIGGRTIRFHGAPMLGAIVVIGIMVLSAARPGREPASSPLAAVPAQEDLRGLIEGLEADGVRAVYAASSDLQWQILFYGRERIATRGRSRADRYPELANTVEEARINGQPTALVADLRQLRRDLPELGGFPGYRVGTRYLRLDTPSILELALLGFELDPREPVMEVGLSGALLPSH